MVEQRDVGQKSGLDYLIQAGKIGPVAQESELSREPGNESVARAASGLEAFAARAVLQAIETLEQPKGSGVRLSRVGEELDLSAEILVPLSRALESLGLTETLEASAFGDDEVKLTDKATKLLEERNQVELLRGLGLG